MKVHHDEVLRSLSLEKIKKKPSKCFPPSWRGNALVKGSIDIFHRWSKKTLCIFMQQRVFQRPNTARSSSMFTIGRYELVVRNQEKSSSTFPVATYITCDYATACVLYFLNLFCQTSNDWQNLNDLLLT